MTPAQQARVQRAKDGRLALLKWHDGSFLVKGTTGVYTVRAVGERLTCTCPDCGWKNTVCKHCCLVAMRTLTPWQQTLFFTSGRVPAQIAVDSRNEECCCCLTTLAPNAVVCPSCRQGFHQDCLDAWLQHGTSCPTCRAPIR